MSEQKKSDGRGWFQEAKKTGKKYISLIINCPSCKKETRFAAFKVEEKQTDKSPDFVVVASQPPQEQKKSEYTPPKKEYKKSWFDE